MAMSIALCKVRFFSASNFFCVLLLVIPHTKRSLSASSKKPPKLQVRAKRLNSITNSFIGSPGRCSRLWNMNRSAITGGFGLKCLINSCLICAIVQSEGASGAVKFFKTVYVLAPNPLNKCATFLLSATPFTVKTTLAVRNSLRYCQAHRKVRTSLEFEPSSYANVRFRGTLVTNKAPLLF